VIVLATPAAATASALRSISPDAATALATVETADVIMVRLAVPAGDIPERIVSGHSGYLVPKSRQRFVTAVSFASQKWAHWQPANGGHLVRMSLGRDGLPVGHLDDDAAIEAAITDAEVHLGTRMQPDEVSVTRWNAAFPQYRPFHHRWSSGSRQPSRPASQWPARATEASGSPRAWPTVDALHFRSRPGTPTNC
jgi:protoporphyrinogen/coproporphyrinogen III oxidase